MTRIRLRQFAASTALALSLAVAAPPAFAQWIVFDPNNFSQNVLTAARELQQITNQITSLQNEAQMLINQARNLASLPYSVAAAASVVDPAHPAAPRPGADTSPTTFSRSTTRSRRPTAPRTPANPVRR